MPGGMRGQMGAGMPGMIEAAAEERRRREDAATALNALFYSNDEAALEAALRAGQEVGLPDELLEQGVLRLSELQLERREAEAMAMAEVEAQAGAEVQRVAEGRAAAAMSDSMGKAVWQAACDANEPELKRLIGLGWNVNWHNPKVRRRMRLAWARARVVLNSTC